VGEAQTIVEGIRALESQPVEVLLVDATSDAHVDSAACTQIDSHGRAYRAIVIIERSDHATLLDVIRCGGSGYLLEDVTSAQLADAVLTVHAGGTPMDPKIANVAAEVLRAQLLASAVPESALTVDDHTLLSHMMQGKTNQEIGSALHLEESVVKYRVATILKKVGARNRVAAAAMWAHRVQTEIRRMETWRETTRPTDVPRATL
jgi:DNA-binding NarL/FixJ family response regulator